MLCDYLCKPLCLVYKQLTCMNPLDIFHYMIVHSDDYLAKVWQKDRDMAAQALDHCCHVSREQYCSPRGKSGCNVHVMSSLCLLK